MNRDERREHVQLLQFVGAILNEVVGEWTDVDGLTVQEAATRCGLAEMVKVEESCGEGCKCEDFPTECFRYTPLGKHATDTADAVATQSQHEQTGLQQAAIERSQTPQGAPK
jgi:hypothetical protein